jgi:hypothetical protein
MDSVSSQEISELRLGKKAEEQLTEAEDLHKKVTPYAYGPPPIRFTEEDIDQARAAGVLIEFERGRPIIVDRPLYRELAKAAVKRTVEDLRGRAVEVEEERSAPAGTVRAPLRIRRRRPSASVTGSYASWPIRRTA